MQISVIVPVFDAARYIREACCSALSQPETGEVVLVEDGSSDDSLAVCEELASRHERVQLLRHPDGANRGASASRNLGIRHARFPCIAFLDADDFYLPGRFETACSLLADDDDLDGVYEAVGTVFEDSQSELWWRNARSSDLTTVTEDIPPEDLFEALMLSKCGHFATDGIVFRARLLARTGLFPEHLSMAEDTCLWLKMACAGRLVGGKTRTPVAMRRVHGSNTIITRQGLGPYCEYAARREVLRWLPREYRTRARLRLIRQALVERKLRYLRARHGRRPMHLRYMAALAWLFLTRPTLIGNGHFRHCAKEATGLLLIRDLLRGSPRS